MSWDGCTTTSSWGAGPSPISDVRPGNPWDPISAREEINTYHKIPSNDWPIVLSNQPPTEAEINQDYEGKKRLLDIQARRIEEDRTRRLKEREKELARIRQAEVNLEWINWLASCPDSQIQDLLPKKDTAASMDSLLDDCRLQVLLANAANTQAGLRSTAELTVSCLRDIKKEAPASKDSPIGMSINRLTHITQLTRSSIEETEDTLNQFADSVSKPCKAEVPHTSATC